MRSSKPTVCDGTLACERTGAASEDRTSVRTERKRRRTRGGTQRGRRDDLVSEPFGRDDVLSEPFGRDDFLSEALERGRRGS